MKITYVELSETAKVLLAEGPGRFRFARGNGFIIGGAALAPYDPAGPFPGLVIGGNYLGDPEFLLAADEKVFALAMPEQPNSLPVVVARYDR